MDTRELNDEIIRIARSMMGGDNRICNHEDLAQDIWVELLRTDGKLNQVSSLDDEERRAVLRKIASNLFGGIISEYFSTSDQYYYHAKEVRGYLEKRPDDSTEAGLDLSIGLEILNDRFPAYGQALFARYSQDTKLGNTERKKVTRAVDTLVKLMNDQHRAREKQYDSGPGSRQARSNANTQFLIKS